MSYGPTKLASRVPNHTPRTLWPSYQEAADINFIGEREAEAALPPHLLVQKYDADEWARKYRGALCDALVLPDHDLDHKTYPGHAPAGQYGVFGPRDPARGNRVGDTLGATQSVLNVRTAGKNIEETRKYLDLGCDPNACFTASRHGDTMGWTAMHFAAKWDRIDVIELLLASGGDPLMRTWDGETPLVIARKKGNWAAYRLLESFIKTGSIDQHAVVSPYKQGFGSDTPTVNGRESMPYLDREFLSPTKPEKPYEDLADDGDPEMYEKPVRTKKAWEYDSDMDDMEPEDFY